MNIADYNEHHKLPVGLNRRGSNTDARKRIIDEHYVANPKGGFTATELN